ncbi:putative flavanone 3-dioxygenase [Medicago truncatula]|uniref:1-aminocyclopropane-1-carboxylate oxidase n=1 Tax=Medicago truncatula TaxID=3880 RepID=A0A072TNY3_MEDTR|nr:protein DMR6-LIKE OXYGENASE 2 [Medicago truncatula]KEH18558.1 1-aminocyclopropane-1-carboxylate oxidase [Medicago truncatula]RHN39624.1 putative flavanone 3-dioxygenase [Medicago truncatula]
MATMKPLVTDLVSTLDHVPSNFIRPIGDRPDLQLQFTTTDSIPTIDLQGLDASNRSEIIQKIAHACRNYGFFQIVNHGVPEEVINNMMSVSKEFFNLPESERMKNYSDDPLKTTRLSTSFNVKTEKVSNWRDYLRLHCHPLEDYVHEWPANPPSFREDVAEYSRQLRRLALRLLDAISESLGLEKDYINNTLGKHGQHMAINYYPPCPEPDLTYGLPAHADPNVITILLQNDVAGLQVLKDGKWVTINPVPNTFIVNIGDQIQVISNDRYKSVLHRALVNSEKERMSIPTFYCPSPDAIIRPAPQLIDNYHTVQYKEFEYNEYYNKFWNRGLSKETCVDMFKV